MIKRANQKKKKGFSLIELIIVLAVMAIIALIAIPNFSAVRENSKNKADVQSCETIKRSVLMLVSDETVTVSETVVATLNFNSDKTFKDVTLDKAKLTGKDELEKALAETKKPQGKISKTTGTPAVESKVDATTYDVTIKPDGTVSVVTAE